MVIGGTHLAIHIGYLSSEDHPLYSTNHLLPSERGPPSPGVGGAYRDRPLLVQIHINVSVWLLPDTKYLTRVCVQPQNDIL